MITKQKARHFFRDRTTAISSIKPISALSYQKQPTQKFFFPPELRQFHSHVLGTTGGGKTRFLEACIREDIVKGHGMILLDPTGNLYNNVVKWCIQKGHLRNRKIILLNPNDPEYTFGFNPLEVQLSDNMGDRERHSAIDSVVDATIRAISSIQGDENTDEQPRYKRVMEKILYSMAENNLTLCDGHIFTEYEQKNVRRPLCASSTARSVRDEWSSIERDGKIRREYGLLMEAPRNRLSRFHSAALSTIVGQQKSTIDFKRAMDDGAIVLVNLGVSRHGLTMEASTIIGRLLLNNIVLRTRERLKRNNRDPRPFFCYIDECHRFMNNDIADGIDELRQNGLRMVLSHQHLGQLRDAGDRVSGSVHANAQTKVYFKLSHDDAATVAERVYAGRISLDESLAKFDKPVTVGYAVEYLESYGESEMLGGGSTLSSTQGKRATSSHTSSRNVRFDSSFIPFTQEHDGTSYGTADSDATGRSVLSSIAQSETYSKTLSKSMNATLVPELAWLPTTRITFEEQMYLRRSTLTMLDQGKCVVALPHQVSFDATVKFVEDPVVQDYDQRKHEVRYYQERSDLYTRKDDVYAAVQSKKAVIVEEAEDDDHGVQLS